MHRDVIVYFEFRTHLSNSSAAEAAVPGHFIVTNLTPLWLESPQVTLVTSRHDKEHRRDENCK